MVIILHGTGRSGTTMLNNILVNHPDLAWLSNYQLKLLDIPQISLLNRLVTYSIDLNEKDRNHFRIHSCNEPYQMWKKYYPNINAENAKPEGTEFLLNGYVEKIIKYSGKKQFVTKITGKSRHDFLNHAFRSYKVVWIDRDPRVVVSSMIKQKWFFKKRKDVFLKLSMKEKIDFYSDFYNNVWSSKKDFEANRMIQVYYEDMVMSPIPFFQSLLMRLDLQFDDKFRDLIDQWKVVPVDSSKYSNQFSENEWAYMHSKLQMPMDAFQNRIPLN